MLQLVAEEASASKQTKIQVSVCFLLLGKADSFFRVHETLLIKQQ